MQTHLCAISIPGDKGSSPLSLMGDLQEEDTFMGNLCLVFRQMGRAQSSSYVCFFSIAFNSK